MENTATARPDETHDALGRLIDRILATHHAYERDAFEKLLPLAEKVARVHATQPAARLAHALLLQLQDELLPHLQREEMILFPYMRQLDAPRVPARPPFGSVRNPLQIMARDHASCDQLLVELRRATDDYVAPEHACRSWQALWKGLAELDADLVAHMKVENEVLFPNAAAREEQHFPRT